MAVKRRRSAQVAAALILALTLCRQLAHADHSDASPAASGRQRDLVPMSPIGRLKQSVSAMARANPGSVDHEDLENFLEERGTTSAARFLEQRSQNPRRASRLARRALKWRHELGVSRMSASQFPCDLFKMGLIFESGRAHKRLASGQFLATTPVIWIRLAALGSIIKRLERPTPARLLSFTYHAGRSSLRRFRKLMRRALRRQRRLSGAGAPKRRPAPIRNLSAANNEPLQQVLDSIVWWLEDWARRHPDTRATLVLDFENTDFAFASWSTSEFFVKLDDMFPDLFEQIIGFRFKPKLWSLHSPISMLNRIFKSRVSSSPETDRKLRFVNSEPNISEYMPRVDSQGFTMLPEHVSGVCVPPDEQKAPPGCVANARDSKALAEPAFWEAVTNEFYHRCRAMPRTE